MSSTIDPLELGPALGYLMLMEPAGGGDDFLYRLCGGRTGSTSFSEAAAAFGAEATLAKPYKSHELLETVNR